MSTRRNAKHGRASHGTGLLDRLARVGLLLAAATFAWGASPSWLMAQPASERAGASGAAFEAKAERLRQSVYRRPRAGAIFDQWFTHYATSGKQPEWVALAEQTALAQPDDANCLLVWGLVCQRLGRWTEAAEAFQAAERLDPRGYYAPERLADTLLRLDHPGAAADALTRALDQNPPRTEFLSLATQLANLQQRLGRRDEALKVWQQLAERFARDPRVLSEIASQLQQLGAIDEALELWQTLLASTSDIERRYDAEFQIARLHLQQGDTATSLGQLAVLLDRIDPKSWRAEELRRLLARVLMDDQGVDGLIGFWQQRVTRTPQDPIARSELASAMTRADRFDDAVREYRAASALAPNDAQLRAGLTGALLRQGNIDAVIADLQQQGEANPRDPQVWMQLGQLQLQQTGVARDAAQRQALESWERAAACRPDEAAVALQVAELCRQTASAGVTQQLERQPTATLPAELQQRESLLLDAAEQFYAEAARRDPAPSYFEYWGEFLHRRGRSDQALAVWRELAADGSGPSWLEAARTMQRYGYADAALDAARQAVSADDTRPAAWQQLVELLQSKREYDEALATCERMTLVRQEDPTWRRQALQLRLDTLTASGAVEQEIGRLRQVLADRPHDPDTLWSLAQLLDFAAEPAESLQALQRLLELERSDANLRRRYALQLSQAGRATEAIAQYQQLLQQDPTASGDDFRRLVELQQAQGQTSDATATVALWIERLPSDPEPYLLQAQTAGANHDSSAS